jgi:hypothetical protein
MTNFQREQFFQIWPDHEQLADQRFLRDPLAADGTEIDPREFRKGARYLGRLPVIVPIANPGKEAAFHLAAFEMPVISAAIVDAIRRIAPADVECFRIAVPGSERSYSILNVVVSLDCLDED